MDAQSVCAIKPPVQPTPNNRFDVTRCRYAELYEKAEMKELGFCLSCCRDELFTKGFNPRMKLLRTQTIMQGSSLCDFRFILE